MTDITKKQDRGIAPRARTVYFTNADASAGDVLLVSASLGHPASHVTIESAAEFQFRINVYNTVYPRRVGNDGMAFADDMYCNLTSGHQYLDENGALITVEPTTVYTLENEIPVRDIQIVMASGIFDIFAH